MTLQLAIDLQLLAHRGGHLRPLLLHLPTPLLCRLLPRVALKLMPIAAIRAMATSARAAAIIK